MEKGKYKLVFIGFLVLLLSGSIVNAESMTTQEKWQRFISAINYSPSRLKNFCTDEDYMVEYYKQKVCANDERCYPFLASRWQEICLNNVDDTGIKTYDYPELFKQFREYMRQNRLSLLWRHKHTESTKTESSTPEMSIMPGSNSNDETDNGRKPLIR